MATNGRAKHEHMSRIPVAYLELGSENNRQALIDFHGNARSSINIVTGAVSPKIVTKLDWLNRAIYDARKRGVRFRCRLVILHLKISQR